MIEESQQLRGAVHWYTTMVGKKITLKEIRKELHSAGVTALRTTELAQVRVAGVRGPVVPCGWAHCRGWLQYVGVVCLQGRGSALCRQARHSQNRQVNRHSALLPQSILHLNVSNFV